MAFSNNLLIPFIYKTVELAHSDPMDKRYLKWYLLVGFLALLSSQFYVRPEMRGLVSWDYWQNLLRYGQIMRLAESRYVDPTEFDYEQFTNLALDGALRQLDVHSSYYTLEDFERFNNDANQTYVGVGIEVASFEQKTVISDVFAEGSAGNAGIRVGDRIVGVDGLDLIDSSIGEILDLIRGETGSEVSIEVERIGNEDRLNFKMLRKEITLQSVSDVSMLTDTIGFVRVRQFTDDTDTELADALKGLAKRGMEGLIIDLRGNPGGRLETATRMASLFLDYDQIILKVQSRDGIEEVIRVESEKAVFEVPVVILLNRQSASASEILAGALQDHGRAVLVGEKSYGKGSVQSVFGFNDGGGMKLTIARYLLPKGAVVNGIGVSPDYEVDVPEEDRARSLLQQHLDLQINEAEFLSFFGFAPSGDRVLEKALEVILENTR
jgi:carboxyl-terminal processing protease